LAGSRWSLANPYADSGWIAAGERASSWTKMSKDLIVSAKTRGFIIVTGCVMSVAGVALGLSLGFAILAAIGMVGVMVQPTFLHLGRGLICAGALLLSFFVFGIGALFLIEWNPNSGIMTADVVELFSVILVAACDVAIVKEEIRIRRAERAVRRMMTEASA
jgi:hypothetical protein